MAIESPILTPDEEHFLRGVIADWECRTPIQRSIAISIMRGNTTVQQIAQNLDLHVDEVRKLIAGIEGILRDFTNEKLYFK